mmetsp:Transcript_50416/g.127031  ORF Transcript_50416/g.127031 Transcript_50416/m.127031 type:complete len:222 (+) Transcript_50416:164-829(+)
MAGEGAGAEGLQVSRSRRPTWAVPRRVERAAPGLRGQAGDPEALHARHLPHLHRWEQHDGSALDLLRDVHLLLLVLRSAVPPDLGRLRARNGRKVRAGLLLVPADDGDDRLWGPGPVLQRLLGGYNSSHLSVPDRLLPKRARDWSRLREAHATPGPREYDPLQPQSSDPGDRRGPLPRLPGLRGEGARPHPGPCDLLLHPARPEGGAGVSGDTHEVAAARR